MRRLVPLLVMLGACSGPPAALDLGPEPEGPPAPILAVSLTPGYTPTEYRKRVQAGQVHTAWNVLVCVECEEEQPRSGRDEVPPCIECGHRTFVPYFTAPYEPALDLARVSAESRRLLLERRGFSGVQELKKPKADEAARWEQAREQGAKWLLEAEVTKVEATLVRTNGWHVPKFVVLIVSSILIFPAVDPLNWFIPGEDYGITTHVRWRLIDLVAKRELASGKSQHRVEDSYAAFGPGTTRPFQIVGFLRVPNSLDEEDWDEIATQLEQRAEIDLARLIVRAAEWGAAQKKGSTK